MFTQRRMNAGVIRTRILAPDYAKIVILAPELTRVPVSMRFAACDSESHAVLLHKMQQLRGRVYADDGAIHSSQLTADGAHCQPVDGRSWHVLSVEEDGSVSGCVRFLQHNSTVRFGQLWVSDAAIARSNYWGRKVRAAVEDEVSRARKSGLAYTEVGGWAVTPEKRCRIQALRVALTGYALGQLIGGTLGISTVTVRNHSSEILRRIGGASLSCGNEEIPTYFDPYYGCHMELLRFDSRAPSPKFLPLIHNLRAELQNAPVICAENVTQPSVERESLAALVFGSRRLELALAS
jgi:hypothetical protein